MNGDVRLSPVIAKFVSDFAELASVKNSFGDLARGLAIEFGRGRLSPCLGAPGSVFSKDPPRCRGGL
jgi:hypothetical protein